MDAGSTSSRLIRAEDEEDDNGAEVVELALPVPSLPAPFRLSAIVPGDLNTHPVPHYLANLMESARPTQRHALDSIARLLVHDDNVRWESCPWHQIRYAHVSALRAVLEEQVSRKIRAVATVNRWLSALKSVLERAWLLGQYDELELRKVNTIHGLTGSDEPAGRLVELWELRKVLDACDGDFKRPYHGCRDGALVALGYAGGFRRTELSALSFWGVRFGEQEIHVIGKGRKPRTVPIAVEEVWTRLRKWSQVRSEPETPSSAPFFCPVTQQQKLKVGKGLAGRDIGKMLNRRIKEAGVDHFSPHDLRRTLISNMLRVTDVVEVQRYVGHTNVGTTARYDRRPVEGLREAAKGLLWPA